MMSKAATRAIIAEGSFIALARFCCEPSKSALGLCPLGRGIDRRNWRENLQQISEFRMSADVVAIEVA
jgi:hypothetical protein